MQFVSTPFDLAWDIIFESSEDYTAAKTLRELFPDNAGHIEERCLSSIHKIVLGLSLRDLEAELCLTNVDAVDAKGRTALMYAASRCDAATVHLLLNAHANSHLCDIEGASALHYAAKNGAVGYLKLLLSSNVDINHTTKRGYTALHFLVSKDFGREVIDCMLTAGADFKIRDVWGSTALNHCAFSDASISATALLDAGADIDVQDNEGDTPISESFYYHADNVLQLLLSRKANYTFNDSHGNSVLHQSALYGGLQTLEIMLGSDLTHLDPDALNRQGKTSRQLAEERVLKEVGFVEKFDELLAQIRVRNELLECSRRSNTKKDDSFMPELLVQESSKMTQGSISTFLHWTTKERITEWISQYYPF